MNIYLRHHRHGTKIATLEQEAIYDEKNGWTRYNPATPVTAAPVVVNHLEVKRKPGRPAKH